MSGNLGGKGACQVFWLTDTDLETKLYQTQTDSRLPNSHRSKDLAGPALSAKEEQEREDSCMV